MNGHKNRKASITILAWNIDKHLTVVPTDIHAWSRSQGMVMVLDFKVVEEPIDLAIAFRDFPYGARQL